MHETQQKLYLCKTGVIKWDPFGGDQSMQMYRDFEGFTLL